MLLGFLFPLGLGLIPYLILLISKTEKGPGSVTSNIYNGGVAVITVGSYFKGALDIYGTTREVYVIIYFVVGILMLVASIVLYVISLFKSSGKSE